MAELTVVRGPAKGASIALSPEQGATIGAAPEADLRVGGEGIADAHVVVKALKGGGFGAKALAGAFRLNGQPTEAARLGEGDVMTIGDSEVRYSEAAASTADSIAGFRLLGVLGRGGWGTVYRAEQMSLGREVALKVLSKERLDDPVFVGRFQAEARAAARLHHPNVVQVFDVDQDRGRWFYSMELMPGGSLEQRLRREGRLPLEDAVHAIRDAARGLSFAEQMRIVHRDIKPDNLMVDRHGHVKIADLGLAQSDEDGDLTRVGTPHFMSPEQIRRQPLDHRSDLYSLGCTFYRLVTGRTPFEGDNVKQILRAQLEDEPRPAHEVAPDLPAALGQIVQRLMRKAADERYPSAAALIEDLDRLLAPPARRGRSIALAAGGALVAGLVAVLVALGREPNDGPPVTRTEIVVDPEAQRALEENRRIAAENALLRVQTQGLSGEELALALDAVAAEHSGTKAATQATEQASRIRDDLRRRAEAAAQRRARVDAAGAALRATFAEALEAGDLPAAAAALAGGPADAELAAAPELIAVRAELDARLQAAAAERLAALRRAVEDAFTAADLAAVDAALAPLEAVVGEGGWPDALLPDRAAWTGFATGARERARSLATDLAEAAQAEAWTALREAVLGEAGLAEELRALRFAAAAARLETVAAAFPDFAAGARAAALAPALRAAVPYLDALRAALATAPLEVLDPRSNQPAWLVALDETGATVRTGSRSKPSEERIPLPVLLDEAAAWLAPLAGARESQRAACLGGIAIGRHLEAAQRYLGALAADDDASGTGARAYPIRHGAIEPALAGLAGAGEPWAPELIAELRATSLLARSLQALSARRNLSAAVLAEQLLADCSGSLVVRSLR